MNGFFQTLQKKVLLSRNLIHTLLADPFQTVLRTVLTEFTVSLGSSWLLTLYTDKKSSFAAILRIIVDEQQYENEN